MDANEKPKLVLMLAGRGRLFVIFQVFDPLQRKFVFKVREYITLEPAVFTNLDKYTGTSCDDARMNLELAVGRLGVLTKIEDFPLIQEVCGTQLTVGVWPSGSNWEHITIKEIPVGAFTDDQIIASIIRFLRGDQSIKCTIYGYKVLQEHQGSLVPKLPQY